MLGIYHRKVVISLCHKSKHKYSTYNVSVAF